MGLLLGQLVWLLGMSWVRLNWWCCLIAKGRTQPTKSRNTLTVALGDLPLKLWNHHLSLMFWVMTRLMAMGKMSSVEIK